MFRLMKILPLALLGFRVFAHGPKVAPDLLGREPGAIADVIVQFKNVPSEQGHDVIRQKGGVLKQILPVVRGAVYSLPVEALDALANDPEVTYISPDRAVHATLDYAREAVNGGIAAKYGFDGHGIGIAIIDSGINNALDFNIPGVKSPTRIVYSQSFVPGVPPDQWASPNDQYGHGTHVAGLAAGNGANSTGSIYTYTFKGIAPAANLINLRVLDTYGNGTDSYVINALQQAINLKTQYNIRVINVSLGRPMYESAAQDPLCQAAEAAWKAGITVVVAAGNSGRDNSQGTNGYATITSPGADPYVITVGAMRTMETISRNDDLIASYSSKGPTLIDHIVKPDLVAPGNRVISDTASGGYLTKTYTANKISISNYESTTSTTVSSTYYRLSGTSMATPLVSGAAALLLQQNPSLTPDAIKARLMKTSSKTFPTQSTAADSSTGIVYTSQYDVFTG